MKQFLIGEKWNKISFIEIKEEFPEFEFEDIIEFSCGGYGAFLSESYIFHSEELKYFPSLRHRNIYKMRGLPSRFSSKKKGKKYIILFKLNKNSKPLEIESYCTCKSGARTIGGCYHTTSILSRITLKKYSGDIEGRKEKKRKKFETVIDLKKRMKK